ncbi:uncharacterized protein TNCV_2822961 [Trichonephila clavipes]|nr:uncharacterized protein TNCV_2822961 [Trichonephila clavipes]
MRAKGSSLMHKHVCQVEENIPFYKYGCQLYFVATLTHHWTEGNCTGKCSKCKKPIKSYNGITGLHCRWCHMTVGLIPFYA